MLFVYFVDNCFFQIDARYLLPILGAYVKLKPDCPLTLTDSTMVIETALKFSLNPEDLTHLAQTPTVRRHGRKHGPTVRICDWYYDDAHRRLAAAGIALRVRRDEKHRLQAIALQDAPSAALLGHEKWEWELPDAELDLAPCAAEPRLATLLAAPETRASLQAIFSSDFRRTRWRLHPDNASCIELSADQGKVSAGERSKAFCEIELTLKSGDPHQLYAIALALAEFLPLRLASAPKAAQGYALLQAAAAAPRKAGALTFAPKASIEETFQAIVQHCLKHLHANSPVLLDGTNPEGAHQMRVATRRLRSCLGLFDRAIPRSRYAAIDAELRWLTGELGPARDWDVLIDETLTPLTRHFPDFAPLQILNREAAAARAAAYCNAQAAVASTRYTRLLLDIGLWRARCAWREGMDDAALARLAQPVRKFAAKRLQQRHERVVASALRFADLSPSERHRLRIQCKRLRYAGEFFGALYPDTDAQPYLQAIAGLQDVLGALNDATVAQSLLDGLAAHVAHDLPAAHLVMGWKAAVAEEQIANFDRIWTAFCAHTPFWR